MKKLFALFALTAALPAGASAHGLTPHGHRSLQQDFSKVEIKTVKVAGNVHMLEGAGGNIGVTSGPDGTLIVDDQFAPLADKIRAALRQLNPASRLRFVLNTHWHGDHTGANRVFGPESTIIAHFNVRKRLAVESRVLGSIVPPSPPEALPVITYDTVLRVHFNGEEIRVAHYPAGHTDGDSIIFFTGSNVVHMGDHFFAGRFPFVDLDNGGSVEGLTRNVADVLKQTTPDTRIIPGHGPVSTPADLRAYHQMLLETTAVVRGRVAAGKTLEQVKAEGLPDKWKTWGTGFINTERWLETLYRSLKPGAAKTTGSLLNPLNLFNDIVPYSARLSADLRRLD